MFFVALSCELGSIEERDFSNYQPWGLETTFIQADSPEADV